MKNKYFKKSISLIMTVLMVLSCWVFFPGMIPEAEAVASNVRGVPAIRGSHYAGTTAAYGTPVFDGTHDRWFKFHNKGSDYVQIHYPSNIYLDKSETLQSAGYFFNVDWAFGNSPDYRILIGANALGDNSQWSGYPDKYYTMTNCFTGYGFDSSVPSGGAKKVYNTSTGGTDYDLRIVGYGHSTQGSDGFDYDGTRHDKYVLYRSYSPSPNQATIYLLGTPNGTYDKKEYNTTGNSMGSYGFQQNYSSRKGWQTNNNSMFKQKSYDAANDGCSSYYEGKYAEMQWFVTVYDKSELNSVINNANSLLTQTGKYTTASLNNLRTVLNNNKGVLTTRATNQSEIKTAKDKIQEAIDNLVEYGVAFDNLFNFNAFTIGGNLTVNERTDKGFTVTSTAADGNTGFSYAIPVVPGKTYVLSADVNIEAVSGGYDMYIYTLDANQAGETTAFPDTSNGAHREGDVYISLTGQTTETKPYIRFTAGNNTKYIKIRFDANTPGNKLTVNNVRILNETDFSGVSFIPTKMYKNKALLGQTFSVPTRTGYTFGGWYADNDSDGIYDAGEDVTDNNGNIISNLLTYEIEKNWTIYSRWTEHKYNIAFNANGGSGSTAGINNVLYSADTKLTTNGFSKTGYTFNGWNTKADGTGTSYANGASVSKLSATNGATVTLYAQWKTNSYTITWKNGDTTLETDTVEYGKTPSYDGTTPTKNYDNENHYTFSGWSPTVTAVTANATYTAQFTATAHSYTSSVTTQPTCSAEGVRTYKCSCGHSYTETIPTTGHTEVTVPGKDATCTETGLTEGKKCSVCGTITVAQTTIPATGHTEATREENKVPATCGADGSYVLVTYCSVCNTEIKRENKTIPATGHSYTSEVTPPTCTAEGYTTHTCSKCGNSYKDTYVDAKGHSYSESVTKNPTCTDKGEKTFICSVCNHSYTEEISATGHTWGETTYTWSQVNDKWACTATRVCANANHPETVTVESTSEVTTSATCTTMGTTTYTATFATEGDWAVTQTKDVADIPALGHSWSDTYTSNGNGETNTHYQTCTRTDCNEKNTAVTHTWNDGEVTTSATCINGGVKTYTCTANGCGATYTETINADGHKFINETEAKGATCTEDGNHAYKQCSVCNKFFAQAAETNSTEAKDNASAFIINKLGHKFVNNVAAKDADCENAGNYAYKNCSACNQFFAEAEELYSENGKKDTTSFVIPAKGHELGDWIVEVPALCNKTGTKGHYTCSVCNKYFASDKITEIEDLAIDLNKNNHASIETYLQNEKPANCGVDGYTGDKYYKCCNTLAEKGEIISASGNHSYGNFTHDENASTHSKICSVCNNTITENCEASDWIISVNATCMEKGSQYKQCTVCTFEMEREEINTISHSFGGNAVNKEAGKHHYQCQNILNTNEKCSEYGNEEACSGGEATCKLKATCSKCNTEYGSLNASNHAGGTYTQDEDIVAGTCKTEKTWNEVTYCSDCNAKLNTVAKTGEKDANNHVGDTYTKDEDIVAGTCKTEKTWNEVTYCSDCNEKLNTVAKTGEKDSNNHSSLTAVEAKSATCNDPGNLAYWSCSGCSKLYSDATATTETKIADITITAKGHTWGDWSYVEEGKHKRVCQTDASHTETDNCIDVDTDNDCLCDACGHLVNHSYGDATCDAPATCTVCKETTGDKLGHSFTNYVSNNNATCTEDGTKTAKCDRCDVKNTVTDIGSAKDHDWDETTYNFAEDGKSCTATRECKNDASHVETATAKITSAVKTPATCTEKGTTTYTAKFEGVDWAETQTKDVVDIDALKHNWADATYNFAADGSACTATRVCKNDASHVETAEATVTSAVKTPATCTVAGWTTYTATFTESWATEQTLDVQDIPAINHSWTVSYSFAEDGKSCTATRECKNDASHVETAIAKITSAVKTSATCTEKGTTTYTAKFEGVDWAETQTKDVVDIDALKHNWADTTYNFAADGSACTATRECKNDASHVETATAKITSAVKTPATCEGMGTTTYTATFTESWAAEQNLNVQDIPAINHNWNEVTYNFAADGSACTTTRVCKNDASHVETAEATVTSAVKTPATCEGMGTTTYTATFEGVDWAETQTKDVEDIAALNHDWNETTYNFAENGSSCTATRVCKRDASHTETVEATITSEVTTAATCEAKGTTTYTATFEGVDWAETQTKDVVDVHALGHDYDTTKSEENLTRPTKNDDGTWSKGYYTYTCNNDNSHTTIEFVDRAGYTAYEAVLANLNSLLATDITSEAKDAIKAAIDENKIADNLIASEQSIVDAATANLTKVFDQYKGSLNVYKVTFKIDGSADVVVEVISGNGATAPADVKKAYDTTYHYVFTGWDVDFTNVTSDLTVTAQFAAVSHSYNHTDKDDDHHTDECGCGYVIDVEHTYDDGKITIASTCMNEGLKTFTCSVCGGTRTEEIDKIAHTPGTAVKEKEVAATCYAEGSYDEVIYCSVEACKHEISRTPKTTDKVAHTPGTAVKENEVVATCYSNGSYDEVIYCSVEACKYEISRTTVEVDAKGHAFIETTEKAATCEEDGNYAYKQCSVCNKYFAADEGIYSSEGKDDARTFVITMLAHSYTGEYVYDNATHTHKQLCVNGCNEYGNETSCTYNQVVTAPTCYTEGYTTYTCTVCKNGYTGDATTRTHSYKYSDGDGTNHKVTCEYEECNYSATEACSGGIANCNEQAVCEKCNTKYGALGHKNTTEHPQKNASCSEDGYTAGVYCEDCKTWISGHELIEKGKCDLKMIYVPSSCEEEGYSYSVCRACGNSPEPKDDPNYLIYEALGHDFTNGKNVIVEPTCTEPGSRSVECTRCGKLEFVGVIEAKGHKYIITAEAIAPTCEIPGKTETKCCTGCGLVMLEIIEPLGHKDEDGDGKCERCSGQNYEDKEDNSSKYCSCLCHKDSGFMKFLYKIAVFFWKLFKMNPACPCGNVHY